MIATTWISQYQLAVVRDGIQLATLEDGVIFDSLRSKMASFLLATLSFFKREGCNGYALSVGSAPVSNVT